MMRIELILSQNAIKNFEVFDRFAQFENSKGKNLHQLLEEFRDTRIANIEGLHQLNISSEDFIKTGIHPALGEVSLSRLLSAWVVHDLDHISQIARTMAKQYKNEAGSQYAICNSRGGH